MSDSSLTLYVVVRQLTTGLREREGLQIDFDKLITPVLRERCSHVLQ